MRKVGELCAMKATTNSDNDRFKMAKQKDVDGIFFVFLVGPFLFMNKRNVTFDSERREKRERGKRETVSLDNTGKSTLFHVHLSKFAQDISLVIKLKG